MIPTNWTPAPPNPRWGFLGRVIRVVIEGVEQTATVTSDSTSGVCTLYLPSTNEYREVEIEWASAETTP